MFSLGSMNSVKMSHCSTALATVQLPEQFTFTQTHTYKLSANFSRQKSWHELSTDWTALSVHRHKPTTARLHGPSLEPQWLEACRWYGPFGCPSQRCQWSMTGILPASQCPCRTPRPALLAEQSKDRLQTKPKNAVFRLLQKCIVYLLAYIQTEHKITCENL